MGSRGSRKATGVSSPAASKEFSTWPFVPNAKLMMQKDKEQQRRRERLRALALGWFMTDGNGGDTGDVGGGSTNGASSGAASGSIF